MAMNELPLGDSGATVSALCLGTMFFGTTVDERTAFAVLDRYYDAGGRFFDTANNYAVWVDEGEGGESEALLGRWMRERGNRDDIFLATKVGGWHDEGLGAAAIARGIEGSLERLGTDRVDLYYAHVEDRSVPQEETVGAFGELVTAGKALHVGCSNAPAWRIERARGIARAGGGAPYRCVQQRHSYLLPRPGTDLGRQLASSPELLDYCADQGVGLLAYSVLLGGAYTRGDRPLPEGYAGADADARLAVLREVAEETGATPNQVVLAWLLRGTPPVIPLIGASSEEQLAENLGALEVELSAEQLERLNA
jgi:aryl-alcohol dehydrogenase-like predicted oxidoreductase